MVLPVHALPPGMTRLEQGTVDCVYIVEQIVGPKVEAHSDAQVVRKQRRFGTIAPNVRSEARAAKTAASKNKISATCFLNETKRSTRHMGGERINVKA